MQGHDRAVPGLQARERLIQQLAIGERAGDVVRRRRVEWRELDLDHPALAAPDEIQAGIDDESVQPGVEAVRVAKPGQVAPGADESLLDRVARELRVAEDQSSRRVQPREADIDERGEGVMFASPRSLDEGSLVHGRLGFRSARP